MLLGMCVCVCLRASAYLYKRTHRKNQSVQNVYVTCDRYLSLQSLIFYAAYFLLLLSATFPPV